MSYRVAGVVKLKGWHWMTKFSGARRRSVRAGAFVFADFATVRRDFGLTQVNFLWANLAPGKTSAELSQSLLPIAERNLGERAPVNGQGTWGPYAETLGNSLRVTTPELIEDRIGARSDDVIWGMSKLPLITLLITFLAVLNTMLASVRARRWDLGVLRAAGVTRSGLVRLVLAESLLVGCVACFLGLAAGLIGGWCGAGASSLAGMWGGMDAALVLPLTKVLPGLFLTLFLCLVAGAWPALRIGRAEVLDLLQAGRGGF